MTATTNVPLPPLEALALRPATPNDEGFLFNLFAVDRAEELKAVGLAGAQVEALVSMQFRGRTFSYATTFPEARSWIADEGTGAVARLLEADQGDDLHIVDIAVLKERRRHGVARWMVESVQQKAAALGKGASAHILAENHASRALFAVLGFKETAQPGEAYLSVAWRA